MWVRATRWALAALAIALVAGCGGESDEDAARQAVEEYFLALLDGDGEAACDQLTGEAERSAVEGFTMLLPEVQLSDPLVSCPSLIEEVNDQLGADEIAELRTVIEDGDFVESVAVDGDTATAVAINPDEGEAEIPLSKSADEWFISDLAGPLSSSADTGTTETPPTTTAEPSTPEREPTPNPVLDARADVTQEALEDAGYKVQQTDPGSGKAAAAFEIDIGGGGVVTVYVYENPDDAESESKEFDFAESPKFADQIEVAVSGSVLYVGTIEEPAVLPNDEFNAIVAAGGSGG